VVGSTARPTSCNGKDEEDDLLLSEIVFNFLKCVICLVNVTFVLYSYIQDVKRFHEWWS
jgi:hypothetical protein